MALPTMIGGMIGSARGAEREKGAEKRFEQAKDVFKKLKIPSIEQQMVDLPLAEYLGDYIPMLEQAIAGGPTAFEDITLDPRLAASQMAALEQLSELSEAGLTPGDLAMMREAQRAASAQEQARQQSILQEMQQRGLGGSGAELAARLASSQASADRLGASGLDMVRSAQERALQSLSQQGALAGQIRGQEYGEQSGLAEARDIVNRFNVENQRGVQQRNVGAQQQSGLRNISEKQRLAEQEAKVRGEQEIRNKALYQQQYQNQLARAQGLAGAYGTLGQQQSQIGAREAQQWAEMGKGVDESGQSMMSMFGGMSDKNIKVNIEDGSRASREFLDRLSPKEYEFAPEYQSHPMAGPGRELGVMAQDVEKAGPIGQDMVVQMPTGEKAIDHRKAMSAMMATQADLNDRIKKLEQLLMGVNDVR